MTAPPQDIDDMIAKLGGDAPASGTGAAPKPPPPKPVYANADAWVRELFINLSEFKMATHSGRTDGRRWCARWWAHPYALDRLEALWRAWEALRLDPGTGLSVWYRDHFTQAIDELMAAEGPFHRCGPDGHNALPPLDVVPAPESILAHFEGKASPTGG